MTFKFINTRLHLIWQTFILSKLEYQRQQLLQERQQFHMEQIKAAEHRARQMAMQQLVTEQRSQSAASPSDQQGKKGRKLLFN